MPRPMTLAEQNGYQAAFPLLAVDRNTIVTAEATGVYNCIAWTIGATDRWINPFDTLQEWDDFYALVGLARGDVGTVVVWKRPAGDYTHGCKTYAPDPNFPWESKCGPGLRINHTLQELVGDTYGIPYWYYGPDVAPAALAGKNTLPSFTPTMNDQQRAARIHEAVKDISPALREIFLEQFKAWKDTWFSGAAGLSSDTRDRAGGYSYRVLLDMGPEIIPLVIEQLADPQNHIAVQLYEDLQPDVALRVIIPASDPARLEGQQGLAKRILDRYLSRTQG